MRDHDDSDATSASAVTCLRLAQRMLRMDRAAAMRQLRLSAELAAMLDAFTLVQLRRLAASGFALCSFRLVELPIAAFGGAPDTADGVQRTDNGPPCRLVRPHRSRDDPSHVWAGRLLRAFAAAGLVVEAAVLTMTLVPSLAARCQSLATTGGAIMGLLAAGIVFCWWRMAGTPVELLRPR